MLLYTLSVEIIWNFQKSVTWPYFPLWAGGPCHTMKWIICLQYYQITKTHFQEYSINISSGSILNCQSNLAPWGDSMHMIILAHVWSWQYNWNLAVLYLSPQAGCGPRDCTYTNGFLSLNELVATFMQTTTVFYFRKSSGTLYMHFIKPKSTHACNTVHSTV